MKANDYVRTKDGLIGKVTKIVTDNIFYVQFFDNLPRKTTIEEASITKSDSNILKLLEPMDLLYVDIDGGFDGGIVVPRIPETLDELDKMIEFINSGQWVLKDVVTHEQLNEVKYDVGE